jgi:hypothetical protein
VSSVARYPVLAAGRILLTAAGRKPLVVPAGGFCYPYVRGGPLLIPCGQPSEALGLRAKRLRASAILALAACPRSSRSQGSRHPPARVAQPRVGGFLLERFLIRPVGRLAHQWDRAVSRTSAAEYRRRAHACLIAARDAPRGEMRTALIDAAQTWLRLAEEQESAPRQRHQQSQQKGGDHDS